MTQVFYISSLFIYLLCALFRLFAKFLPTLLTRIIPQKGEIIIHNSNIKYSYIYTIHVGLDASV